MIFTLENTLILSIILIMIGFYGIFARRNLLLIFISIEVALNGVNLSLVAFNYFRWATSELGQYLYMLSIGVAAVEAAVGLSLLIVLFKNTGDVKSETIARLGERS